MKKKSYKYIFEYSINDFGKQVATDKNKMVIVTPQSSKKIRIDCYYKGVLYSTGVATLYHNDEYRYVSNALYKGYISRYTWKKTDRMFIMHGFEEGDSYFRRTN